MGVTGLEQSALTEPGTPISKDGGAKCGATWAETALRPVAVREVDADLQTVIEAWPGLSREKRELVLGIVRI